MKRAKALPYILKISLCGGKNMYRTELHSHSMGVSICAHAAPEVVIARYKAAGYHSLVSTNHINKGTFAHMEEASWEEKIAHFMTGYEGLKKAAGKDMHILLGCEINLSDIHSGVYIPNDYLVYGVTKEWLLELGDPRSFTLKQLSERVRADGLLLIQAHPFRYGCQLMKDTLLDGIEVYNAHLNHDSHNYLADLWADVKNLRKTSGSDFHDPDGNIGGGIETEAPITDNDMLLRILKNGEYRLIRE